MDLSLEEMAFMERSFQFAYEALYVQEVPVGCIFVYNGDIIALGRNMVNETKNATRHAEINCIDQVHDYCKNHNVDLNSVFSELSVYVTVELCIMCATALYELKVKSIIFGCKNDRFGGNTVFDVANVLSPITLVKGEYRAAEAMDLLKKFYKGINPNAPSSKVKIKQKRI